MQMESNMDFEYLVKVLVEHDNITIEEAQHRIKNIMSYQENIDENWVGKYVYIVKENCIKYEAQYVPEHWYQQDYVILKCKILNTMKLWDGTELYNIRFNNSLYQLNLNNIIENTYTHILKYNVVTAPNGKDEEVLGNSPYVAYFNYNDAMQFFMFQSHLNAIKIKDAMERYNKNMTYITEYLNRDIAVDADEYDEAITKSWKFNQGYTDGGI